MAKATKAKTAPKKSVKKETDGVRDYASILYMQRLSQNEIAERCNVSVQTISAWKKADNWEAKRGAKIISLDTLFQKLVMRMNEMLDAGETLDADAFAKAAAQLKALKSRNTIDDEINCFLDFQSWLLDGSTGGFTGVIAPEETQAFIKSLVKLQDRFIKTRLGNV